MSNDPEQSKQTDQEDNGSALLMFTFIFLLILKAVGMDISWWIVVAPLAIPFIYLTIAGMREKK